MNFFKDASQGLQILKLLLVVALVFMLITGLRSCADMLPSWMTGDNKAELQVKNASLETRVKQLVEDNKTLKEDAIRKENAEKAVKEVMEAKDTKIKTLQKDNKAISKELDRVLSDIEKNPNLSDGEKTAAAIDASVDSMWQSFCLVGKDPSCANIGKVKQTQTEGSKS